MMEGSFWSNFMQPKKHFTLCDIIDEKIVWVINLTPAFQPEITYMIQHWALALSFCYHLLAFRIA
jgi:hypothetical protein